MREKVPLIYLSASRLDITFLKMKRGNTGRTFRGKLAHPPLHPVSLISRLRKERKELIGRQVDYKSWRTEAAASRQNEVGRSSGISPRGGIGRAGNGSRTRTTSLIIKRFIWKESNGEDRRGFSRDTVGYFLRVIKSNDSRWDTLRAWSFLKETRCCPVDTLCSLALPATDRSTVPWLANPSANWFGT